MFSGRSVILVMVALGAVLLAGYEFVRRSAMPHGVSEVKDLGDENTFDRIYTIDGTRYHVGVGKGERGKPVGTVSVAQLADDGTNASSIIRPRHGPIREAFFLEVEQSGPPSVVVIIEESLESKSAGGLVFTLTDGEWEARPLGPLPEELESRYIGHDEFEQQGAFLYRTVRLEGRIDGDDPVDQQLFYDWRQHRWQIAT